MLPSGYFKFNTEQAPCLIFKPGTYPMLKDRQLHDADAHLDLFKCFTLFEAFAMNCCFDWIQDQRERERRCHT